MNREREAERMDEPDADPAELWRSLRDLERVNRWRGGHRSAVGHVLELALGVGREVVRGLDVGTGGGDVPLRLTRTGRRAGVPVRVLATDLHATTLEYARRSTARDSEVEVTQADALDLPFEDGSFDIAMICTTLHHFSEEDAVQVLREMGRVATVGVVVTDLERSKAALIGANLLARTIWRSHPITRHDGPASVRAAFTVEEMGALVSEAFGRPGEVKREPIFRLSAVVRLRGRRE